MSDGKLRFYDKGKETFAIEDPYWGGCKSPETQLYIKEMTHEEMLETAKQREEENIILAKISDKDLKKVQDALKVAKKGIKEYKPALEELAKTEKPFYRFFAVEYFGTGEGMSYWLQISRNYEPYNGVDYQLKNFEKFVGNPHYLECFEEKTEEEFMERYGNLIPHYVKVCVERKDQPAFTFQVHTHVNYS